MKIHIKTKNMDMTQAIKNHAETKINEIEKFISHPVDSVEVWVEVGKSNRHHRHGDVFEAIIDIKTPGKIFRAKKVGNDLYVAITEARDQLQREIRKFKEKGIAKDRKKSRLMKIFKNLMDKGGR